MTRSPTKRSIWTALAALVVVLALNILSSTTATAIPRVCQKSDARQAIVLVHGYNSGPSAWSADSLAYLTADNDRRCYSLFDYSADSTYWVDDGAEGSERISRRLAEHIKMLAGASRAAGGSGKVVVVAHSMGGLATRCALDAACSGVKDVANQVAGVVTIGTPHQGSFLRAPLKTEAMQTASAIIVASCVRREISCNYARAIATSDAARAFAPGSDELTSLPEFPRTVPVFAIAGSVKLQSKIFFKELTLEVGDLIVGTSSATARSQKVDGIGGTTVHDCGTLVYKSLINNSTLTSALTGTSDRLCWHSDLTNDRAVLADALHVITQMTENIQDSGTSTGASPPDTGLWPIGLADAEAYVTATTDHLAYTTSQPLAGDGLQWQAYTAAGEDLGVLSFGATDSSWTCAGGLVEGPNGKDVWITVRTDEVPAQGVEAASRTDVIVVSDLDGRALWEAPAWTREPDEHESVCPSSTAFNGMAIVRATTNGAFAYVSGHEINMVGGYTGYAVDLIDRKVTEVPSGMSYALLAGNWFYDVDGATAWSPVTGKSKEITVELEPSAVPAADGSAIVFGVADDPDSYDGALVALDLDSGQVAWRNEKACVELACYTGTQFMLDPGGDLLVVMTEALDSYDQVATAFDPATGKQKWSQPIEPCFIGSSRVIGSANDQSVMLDASTGEQLLYNDPDLVCIGTEDSVGVGPVASDTEGGIAPLAWWDHYFGAIQVEE